MARDNTRNQRRERRTEGPNDGWKELTGEVDVPDSMTRNLSPSRGLELRLKNAGQAEINSDNYHNKQREARRERRVRNVRAATRG